MAGSMEPFVLLPHNFSIEVLVAFFDAKPYLLHPDLLLNTFLSWMIHKVGEKWAGQIVVSSQVLCVHDVDKNKLYQEAFWSKNSCLVGVGLLPFCFVCPSSLSPESWRTMVRPGDSVCVATVQGGGGAADPAFSRPHPSRTNLRFFVEF